MGQAAEQRSSTRSPIESGDPRVEADGFRRSLAEFATGVTVIATSVDGERFGLTSNSFASVSLDPPLVLWSIRRESKSFAAFAACSHFAVNILAEDQIELSQRFARSGPDKFRDIDCRAGQGDAPLLAGAAASFECVRSQTYDGGDHLILIGEVLRYSRYDRQPLLFVKGRYAVSADHPDTRIFTTDAKTGPLEDGEERVLSNLMIRAYSAIASRLERGRQTAGLGLTLMQARLLRAAASSPDRTIDELMPELLLDFNASRNLLEFGSVVGPRCRRWSRPRSAHGGGRGASSRHRRACACQRGDHVPGHRRYGPCDGQARSQHHGVEAIKRLEAGGGSMSQPLR